MSENTASKAELLAIWDGLSATMQEALRRTAARRGWVGDRTVAALRKRGLVTGEYGGTLTDFGRAALEAGSNE